jgi:MFS superfamily sulfate permease-like transporter
MVRPCAHARSISASLIRLGWVADYFSRAVLTGYLHGVAVVLIVGQLAKLFGLDVDAQNPPAQPVEVVRELSGLHATTLVVGGLSLAALLGLRWPAPKLPGALLVVAIAASAGLELPTGQGMAVAGEYGGSAAFVVEYAPAHRRGWYGGWQWATIALGLAAGIATAAALSAALDGPR